MIHIVVTQTILQHSYKMEIWITWTTYGYIV